MLGAGWRRPRQERDLDPLAVPRRQDIVALRQELRTHRIRAAPSVAEEAETAPSRINREAIQRQYDALTAERAKLFERLQQVQTEMSMLEVRAYG